MCKLGVEEGLVLAVISMYTGAKTVVRTVYGNNKNGISGSFTFHKSELHMICVNLLLYSVFEDSFYHFHSMF